jgi:hypothetical protein
MNLFTIILIYKIGDGKSRKTPYNKRAMTFKDTKSLLSKINLDLFLTFQLIVKLHLQSLLQSVLPVLRPFLSPVFACLVDSHTASMFS